MGDGDAMGVRFSLMSMRFGGGGGARGNGVSFAMAALAARRAPILAFSHKNGLYGEFDGGKTRASARDTPILAFPHKGGRDLSLVILAWFPGV